MKWEIVLIFFCKDFYCLTSSVCICNSFIVVNEYNGDDTLLFNYENTDAGNKINAYYELEDANDYNEAQATQDIEKVFRKGQENGQVAKASVRTDYEFFVEFIMDQLRILTTIKELQMQT